MREAATTLSDYGLALLGAGFAVQLGRGSGSVRARGPVIFFGGFAAAAAVGGTWHGYFSAEPSRAADLVWWVSMLFVGVSALGLARTGLDLLAAGGGSTAGWASGCALVAYSTVTWRDPRFVWCVAATAAGTLACMAGLARRVLAGRPEGAWPALAGFALSIAAAVAQQRGVALRPPAIDHNATYHLALFPALALIYTGLARIAGAPRGGASPLG